MENVTLQVKGMSCGHCINAIEGSVGKLAGVKMVKVNLEKGTVDLDFDREKVSLDEIKETIDEQGYDVA